MRHKQTAQLLRILRDGPATTTSLIARGMIRPAARVFDLRSLKYRIATKRVRIGRSCQAQYRLVGAK